MTERRACDVICVTKRIFVHSFVKLKNIRLVGFDIRFTTTPNIVSCRQSKNYDLQSVCSTCSTCKNVQYMYRTFSVAVSVAVMLLKKGSVERF